MNLLFPFAVSLLLLAAPTLARAGTNRFQFREPLVRDYQIETPAPALRSAPAQWLRAVPVAGDTNAVAFGSRVVLQLREPTRLNELIAGRPLQIARALTTNLFILQAPDAPTAANEAARLAALPEVQVSRPVVRRTLALHGPYAPAPNDPYFYNPAKTLSEYQWYLENRDTNGAPLGVDLNARAAWPYSRGEGVIIAFGDVAAELAHPDLAPRAADAPHFNFVDGTTNLILPNSAWHATCVAGLALAEGDNQRGIAGVAPRAGLASWMIFPNNNSVVGSEELMEMFQFRSNIVSVQNHSWGVVGRALDGPTVEERVGIDNAVLRGRAGRGVVIVRSAGNERARGNNANDSGYLADRLVIGVGAVGYDGRVTSYSAPGACLLVAAPGGDGSINTITTDRTGTQGYNFALYPEDPPFADYASFGFFGTSAAAPLIAGTTALVLGANPDLTYRDVQQILLLSARHFDFADPDLQTNGAGLRVSHNVGFGVPDAGFAVQLARRWSNHPPAISVTFTATNVLEIPNDGLRVAVTGENIPPELAAIPASPGSGLHPDAPTLSLPLVDVGQATTPITQNLTGRVALIERGINSFAEKIAFAAQAGASAAIIFNNTGTDQRLLMQQTDFVPIHHVLIGRAAGLALREVTATNATARARLELHPVVYEFEVTNTLVCEHVAVRLLTSHFRRGDLRITLVSPAGTRSVLQRANFDNSHGPVDWTYVSTHHFFESSAGAWRVEVSDEETASAGSVLRADLTIHGVPIADGDGDGLADEFDRARLSAVWFGPRDDADGDGFQNAWEQLLGANPLADDVPFRLDLARLNERSVRLTWPGSAARRYDVFAGSSLAQPLALLTNVAGRFPETELVLPNAAGSARFFRVQRTR